MIFVTGDTHGSFEKFSVANFHRQKRLTKKDYVIICGDFGIWDDSPREKYMFDWLESKPFTTLFVDGNHENFELLNSYPVEQWNGGEVHFIRPSVIHLMRGNLFEIDGKKIFAMGGAASHDVEDGILDKNDPDFKAKKKKLDRSGKILYRVKGESWWEEELPNDAEYEKAKETLEKCGYKVDYMITHCAPKCLVEEKLGRKDDNRLTCFFEEISKKCEFDYWFFGHYHANGFLNEKYCFLFDQIFEVPKERFKLSYGKESKGGKKGGKRKK